MKIMHVAGGGDRGGAKTHILSLCERLKRDHDIELISMRKGEFADEAVEKGIKTRIFYSKLVFLDYFRFVKHVRREKPDIVHCHGAKANTAAMFLKLFFKKHTTVTTVHSDYRLDYLHSFVKRMTIGKLNAFSLRFFNYYITVSDQFSKMLISRGFSPNKIMTIYNGLDFSTPTPSFDRGEYLRAHGLNYEGGDVVLGIAARLTPVKDIATLLSAFAAARKQNDRLRLAIGGDGEDMQKLQRQAQQLNLGRDVCFFGWVSDVASFYAACDISVLCSISESFPYALLEGIKEGCATITSDVGGARALIDHGRDGYIFEPRDVAAFTGYILELSLDVQKRRAFAQRLLSKSSSLYSLDNMAKSQVEIYQNILTIKERHKQRYGVLICGAYGRGNSGDEAILTAILQSMRQIDPLMPLTVMTRKPKATELLHGVRAIYTFNILSFWASARKSKLFINGGGSLIQDVTSSRSLYFYLYTIFSAKRQKCNVIMYGCSIGRISKSFNAGMTKKVLNSSVDIITLRDSESMRELKQMGVTKPDIRLSADPVVCLTPASGEAAADYMLGQGINPEGNYICFALRAWRDFDRYDIFTKAAEYAYTQYGLTAVFFPIERPSDYAPSHMATVNLLTPHHVLTPSDDVSLTIALMGKMRLVCAIRLHALVFATAVAVPFIAASYDIKVSGFMDYIGAPDACQELDKLNYNWLSGQIDSFMQERHDVSAPSLRLHELEKQNTAAARELL